MKPDYSELCRRAVQDNDSEAYTTTFGALHDQVYRFAFRRTRDENVAEEILEATILTIFAKSKYSFASEIPLRVWLFRIAENLIRQRFRRTARDREEPLDEARPIPGREPEPSVSLVADENRASVRTALSLLSEVDSTILALAAEDHSRAEIAEILELTEQAVANRLCRALTHLHATLQTIDPFLADEYPRGGGRRAAR